MQVTKLYSNRIRHRTPVWLRLLPQATALLLVALLTGSAAMAWVTINRRAVAQDLSMTAKATGNLVIAKKKNNSVDGIKNPNILERSNPFSVSFSTVKTAGFLPCSHNDDANAGATKLYYYTPADSRKISYVSGTSLEEITKTDVAVDDTLRYKDFTVYIASAGSELQNVTLSATVTPSLATLSDTQRALTIDFWMGGVYQNKANIKNGETTVTLNTTPTNLLLNTKGCCTITMRVYYDGALTKDDGTAYVRSAALDTTKLGLTVTFHASVSGE